MHSDKLMSVAIGPPDVGLSVTVYEAKTAWKSAKHQKGRLGWIVRIVYLYLFSGNWSGWINGYRNSQRPRALIWCPGYRTSDIDLKNDGPELQMAMTPKLDLSRKQERCSPVAVYDDYTSCNGYITGIYEINLCCRVAVSGLAMRRRLNWQTLTMPRL